ncbi:hypothetical protein FB451DRAFT_1183498 [Mycena latifolia]|nr:hypothetical protein FB451DRAFT_1183498 [Mycena latifolia]
MTNVPNRDYAVWLSRWGDAGVLFRTKVSFEMASVQVTFSSAFAQVLIAGTQLVPSSTLHFTTSAVPRLRADLEDRLTADFPVLFKLGCSCDIGDGWEPILRRLCVDLEPHKKLRFEQIKEKMGGLRVYTTAHRQYNVIQDRVNQAEDESFRTCETCGADGRMAATEHGWLFTTCQACLDREVANGRKAGWDE